MHAMKKYFIVIPDFEGKCLFYVYFGKNSAFNVTYANYFNSATLMWIFKIYSKTSICKGAYLIY